MSNTTGSANFQANMDQLKQTQQQAQKEFFELTIHNTQNKTAEAVASSNIK
ncbi:hypothetical protein IB262_33180 [Ensifer sp. ENS02]|uniref:hypothetical protein n=1 Tax=Ensifer sp. ENS02 TaxID=2769290 RepID=UPI001786FE7C|nr:hypothetical protein [Ensifer sp. ENS02]MBD9524731.1 hypothetical protein [Ensifer sp. ENS02]